MWTRNRVWRESSRRGYRSDISLAMEADLWRCLFADLVVVNRTTICKPTPLFSSSFLSLSMQGDSMMTRHAKGSQAGEFDLNKIRSLREDQPDESPASMLGRYYLSVWLPKGNQCLVHSGDGWWELAQRIPTGHSVVDGESRKGRENWELSKEKMKL